MEGQHSGLTRLQRSAGEAFFSLPESDGFLLAGGGALIAQGLVARTTEDLDLFATRGCGDVVAASAALLALADDRGWTAEITRAGPEFRRIVIEADVGAGVEVLRAHRRLSDDEFPDAGEPVERVRAFFNEWADDLEAQPQS